MPVQTMSLLSVWTINFGYASADPFYSTESTLLLECILVEIPAVTIQIFKDHNSAIFFFAWFFAKMDTFCLHLIVITPEIIGLQEQKHPTATLVANKVRLPLI